jgi:cellulose synthase/poly-beta-1,6-N-acetylglucosamine synthase-like glycosyltransferase
VTVFVIADNCTDNTAGVARVAGAKVYERFNKTYIGKGYALEELTRRIRDDYGAVYDGYFVFDADNILENNYIAEMNKTFSDGYEIVTSYRNSKNYGDNWISSGYALWFLRESKYLNNSRHLIGSSCAVSGTGFLFSQRILDKTGGWCFYLLTEDIEFSVQQILDGEKIGFCRDAVLYDEQPIKFRQSLRQRMRWAKGYLQVFRKYGFKLIGGIFKGSFAAFDMTMSIMPAIILTCVGIVANVSIAIIGAVNGDNLLIALDSLGESLRNAYLLVYALGLITTISEWRNIHTSVLRKIVYTFTFPLFMFTYIPISFIALFAKVTWKPIEHSVAVSWRDIDAKKRRYAPKINEKT